MRVKNLTPHDVRILAEDGSTVTVYPPAGPPVRLRTEVLTTVDSGGGFPMHAVQYLEAQDAPEQDEDTVYIVSLPTALAVRRDDFLVPYDEVRDEQGRIIGCLSLAMVSP